MFEYGDIGEHFYLILEGHVEIQIPNMATKKEFDHVTQHIMETKDQINTLEDAKDRYNEMQRKLEQKKEDINRMMK